MSVNEMRSALCNVKKYNRAPTWIARVGNMHDNQVIAVYYRMLSKGEL